MAARRTLNLLPIIFQTDTNSKFLSATMDQLVSEPNLTNLYGYIGRKFAPTYKSGDSYVTEHTADRQNYQLEPSVVIKNKQGDVTFFASYIDFLNKLKYYGGYVNNQSRLFTSDYYSFDPLISYDKFVNFSQYYWLPDGPDPVEVDTSGVELQTTYSVTRDVATGTYIFKNNGVIDNSIILARGGSYSFVVNQPGVPFWIQSELGTEGVLAATPTISSRDVLGVVNNGIDVGTVTFNVPSAEAQDRFISMPTVANVAYAAPLAYENLQNHTVSDFLSNFPQYAGITGQLDGKTFVFIDQEEALANLGEAAWTTPAIYSATMANVVLGTSITLNAGDELSQTTSTVTFSLTTPISANVGDIITQTSSGANVIVTSAIVNSNTVNGVYNSVNEFNQYGSTIAINGTPTLSKPLTVNSPIVTTATITAFQAVANQKTIIGTYADQNTFNVFSTNLALNGVSFTSRPTSVVQGVDLPGYDAGVVVPEANRYGVWRVQYIDIGIGEPVVRLVFAQDIGLNQKVYIRYGVTNANKEYYKDYDGFLHQVPLITTSLDTLWIQDGVSSVIYQDIKLVEYSGWNIDVENDIIGRQYYTSPNGVEFTTGLKVQFGQDVIPASYQNKQYYVEGVGSSSNGIRLVSVDNLVIPEVYHDYNTLNYPGQIFPEYITINRSSLDQNGWARNNRWFHKDVITATAKYNGVPIVLDQKLRGQRPIVQFDADIKLINSGSIAKAPIDILDVATLDAFTELEGQTLTRAFGIELTDGLRVLFANDIDPLVRNKIYTINLVQYQYDPVSGEPIGDLHIKLTKADDGDAVTDDTVIVTQGTYKGSQWWYDGTQWLESQLKSAVQQEPLFDVFDGNGKSLTDYYKTTFAGTKIFGYLINSAGVNDSVLGFPLSYRNFGTQGDIEFGNYFNTDTFNFVVNQQVVTENVSMGYLKITKSRDTIKYKNTWTTVTEPSKQYQLIGYVYNGVSNVFPIDVTPNEAVSIPYLKVFKNYTYLSASQWVLINNQIRLTASEVFVGDGTTTTFLLASSSTTLGVVMIINGTTRKAAGLYGVNGSVITFTTAPAKGDVIDIRTILNPTVGDQIDILVYSDEVSKLGYYEIPSNLDLNAQNIDINTLTLGQMRNHLVALGQNSTTVVGNILGDCNLRDVDIKQQGGTILQHSAPIPYAELFLLDDQANFVDSLRLAQREYSRFKNKFLDLSVSLSGINPEDPAASIDLILKTINLAKNKTFPWYYSDMVPYGTLKNTINYTVYDPLVTDYELTNVFNDQALSNQAVLIYLNGSQLARYVDYTFRTDRPAVTISATLNVGDELVIYEYANTDGCYIPETPTKLGLWPTYIPVVFVDNSYRDPITVIRGHDGSVTPAFGDYRDAFLYELELRMFNNIKLPDTGTYQNIYSVIPGKFRKSDYTLTESSQLVSKNFLNWIGNNKLDYSVNNTFNSDDPFTWNYSSFTDRVDGARLPGSWRACYQYFYDTFTPHLTPWEMLGFATMPDWWESYYGPAPYTGGNKLLWDDLEAGRIRQGIRSNGLDENGNWIPSIDTHFTRPGLSTLIPVDDNGFLLSPAAILASSYHADRAASAWSVGQYGPVEFAWRSSSDFPYAVQQALAMAKPAEFFGQLLDTYNISSETNPLFDNAANNANLQGTTQFLNIMTNHHVRQADINFNGDISTGTVYRGAGYLNWIADYLINQGVNPSVKLNGMIKDYQVNLSYKAAGFTDQTYLSVLAEQNSPASTNDTIVIPNENYKVHLNKSTPTQTLVYSAVIVEKTTNGFSVRGYDLNNPYFTIIPSEINSHAQKITVLNSTTTVFKDYQKIKITVPYGYEFTSQQQLVDFLISYERFLIGQGFTFNDTDGDLGATRNWTLSAKEFMYWAQQGWKAGSIIVLSPVANSISAISFNAITDGISDSQYGSKVLDQNFNMVKKNEYVVMRSPNSFKLSLTTQDAIAYVEVDLVQYEHVLLFDNTTVFNDIIYKPELGNRQYRLKLIGQKTASWDGSLSAPGFIYNDGKVSDWEQGVDYLQGDLVQYKNQYYTALQDVAATATFDFTKWKQINKSQIQTGLLPNFSTLGAEGKSYYDSYPSIDNKKQIDYSHGLIGFRPRQYLSDLGLTETTQIEFYKGFIKQKGSANAVNQMLKAVFNNLTSEINFYEEYAIRIGAYGALDSNPFVEIPLDERAYSVNPQIAQFVGQADNNLGDGVTVFNKDQLYKSSDNFTGNIALNRTSASDYASDIPTAGYVNLNDVDVTIFDLANYVDLDNKISKMGSGYRIWCAKDFTQNWNVYRITETDNHITTVGNALSGYITFTTRLPHNFVEGSVFLAKDVDTKFDGFYEVYKVTDLHTVTVKFNGDLAQLAGFTNLTTFGLVFRLDSMRFQYMEDSRIYGLTNPPNGWKVGDKIWIDDDAATTAVQGQPFSPQPSGTWKVYEKTHPWNTSQSLLKNTSEYSSTNGFGTSVRMTADGLVSVVGAPYTNNIGIVNVFLRGHEGDFAEASNVAPDGANTSSFGSTIDIVTDANENDILATGAPTSNYGNGFVYISTKAITSTVFSTQQIIVGNTADAFGSSLAFNQTGEWLYVGAPTNDRVYVYGLNRYVPYQQQTISINNKNIIKLTGALTKANVGDIITQPITGATALVTNASASSSNVQVNTTTNILTNGQFVILTLTGNISANTGSYITQATSGANINVYQTAVGNNVVYGEYISNTTPRFDTTGVIAIDGSVQAVIPTKVGSANIYLNGIDTGFYANIIYSQAVTNTINLSFTPYVANDANSLLIKTAQRTYIPTIDYSLSGNVVTFAANVAQNDITIVQQPYYTRLTSVTGNAGSKFGYAVSSSFDGAQLAVGAPNDTILGLNGAGSVQVYDRVIEAFNSTGSTDYVTKNKIASVYKVLVDSVEVTNYFILPDNQTVRFITPPPLGRLIFIEVNQFNKLEQLIGVNSLTGGTDSIQSNAAFGTSLTICSNNCAIYVGAPGYDAGTEYNTGAVWKFHNRGRLYGTNTGYKQYPTFTVGDSIRLNNFEITIANVNTPSSMVASIDDVVTNINSAGILGVSATNQNGYLRLNSDVTVAKDQLRILSGIVSGGSAGVYVAADLRIFAYMQIITNPYHMAGEHFGSKVKLASNAYMLVIGSGQGTTKAFTTFDSDKTTYDVATTRLLDSVVGSGSVYIYELYDDPRNAVEHPGRYAFCQQLDPYDSNGNQLLASGAQFGYSLDIEGPYIIISAPGDSTVAPNSGAVYVFNNPTLTRGWNLIRYQQPKVDIESVARIYMYSNQTNTILDSLQYIDPAKGRILGQAEQEITYKTEYDPAIYNNGSNANADINSNLYWGPDQVGKVWWNLSQVRYIDYEQDTLTYRSINWGQLFPGSVIEVLEWVESPVLPSQWVKSGGDGVPKYADNSAYVEIINVDPTTNIIGNKYYFWVANKTTVDATDKTRLLPIQSIANYIENPKGQGIAYAAVIQSDAISLYNVGDYLSSTNTILHVDYDLLINTNLIHSEYELVQKGNNNGRLPTKIINKLVDSLSGLDTNGGVVPDPTLGVADRYGIDIRPRQSMFVDRLTAVTELVTFVNGVFAENPIAKEFDLAQMQSAEPVPNITEGIYDYELNAYVPIGQTVDVDGDLAYLDTGSLSTGYKVLVLDDTTQDDLWVIYQLTELKTWEIYRVQAYKTNLYWEYMDWYASGYDATTKPTFAVETTVDALKLGAIAGDLIKINNASGDGTWQLVIVNGDSTFTVVGIQNGTIQLKSSLGNYVDNALGFDNQEFDTNRYDQNPNIEMRSIIAALRDDIFVNTLQGKFNDLFFVMINYLFTEQKYVDWIFKSSFISVKHQLRTLSQFPSYVQDNQTYYQSYIDEVKPYRTKVREYLIDYTGSDTFAGTVTDFDLPSYYDTTIKMFRSPSGEDGFADSDLALWQTFPYNQWYGHKTLQISAIVVDNTGYGYTIPPVVTIYNADGTPTTATATAILDGNTGAVVEIKVTNPGSGFVRTPKVVIVGSCVIPAVAYAVLKNNQVRSINTTLKFDRITYNSQIQPWRPNTQYYAGDIITYLHVDGIAIRRSYIVNEDMISGPTFLASDYTLYSADKFTNANDRILGYYQPSTSMPSVETVNIPLVVANTTVNTNSVYVLNGSDLTTGMSISGPGLPITTITGVATKISANISGANIEVTQVTLSSTITADANTDITATQTSLGQIVSGIEYPGVQLSGLDFGQQPGFSMIGFDDGVFDNIQYDADGTPVLGNEVLDNIIRSNYTDSALGTRAEDINVDGGAYVDRYSSHAPEELVPGIVFDTLSIKVFTQIDDGKEVLGYRIFNNMLRDTTYIRIADANTTTLAANLQYSDTQIFVSNSSVLPVPDPSTPYPGVVFINSERITYWTNDTVNNVLGQIRRGTEGTSVSPYHAENSLVVDASVQQYIPGVINGNVTTAANTTYQASGTVSYTLALSGNVTANVGDVITQSSSGAIATVLSAVSVETNTLLVQYDSGIAFNPALVTVTLSANVTANVGDVVYQKSTGANLVVLSTASNNQLVLRYNNAYSLKLGSGNVKIDGQDAIAYPVISTISSTDSPISINGVLTANVYPLNASIQGFVNAEGNVTVAAGTFLYTSNVWQNWIPGVGTDTSGFEGATTAAVLFLKEKVATFNTEYTASGQIGTEDGVNTILTEDGSNELYGG